MDFGRMYEKSVRYKTGYYDESQKLKVKYRENDRRDEQY